jgi:hypothetical protein
MIKQLGLTESILGISVEKRAACGRNYGLGTVKTTKCNVANPK